MLPVSSPPFPSRPSLPNFVTLLVRPRSLPQAGTLYREGRAAQMRSRRGAPRGGSCAVQGPGRCLAAWGRGGERRGGQGAPPKLTDNALSSVC